MTAPLALGDLERLAAEAQSVADEWARHDPDDHPIARTLYLDGAGKWAGRWLALLARVRSLTSWRDSARTLALDYTNACRPGEDPDEEVHAAEEALLSHLTAPDGNYPDEVTKLRAEVRSLTERAEAAEGELDDLSTLVHYDGGDSRGHLGECFSSVMDQWRHGRAAVKALLNAAAPKAKAQAICDLYGAMFPDEADEDAPTEPDYEELVEAEQERDALAEQVRSLAQERDDQFREERDACHAAHEAADARLAEVTTERDQARAERQAAWTQRDAYKLSRDTARSAEAGALSRLSRAREALDRPIGREHHALCDVMDFYPGAPPKPCNCGLDALRAALTEETTPRE